jgi:hypothetical protein
MMRVDAALPLTGITIENLTFCGNNNMDRSVYVTNPSVPAVCPAAPASPTNCDNIRNDPSGPPKCVDLQIDNAALPSMPGDPFNSASYSVTIANSAFEDAAGHAIFLGYSQTKKVHDVYIHDTDASGSATTGILVLGGQDYDRKQCDSIANFSNDSNVLVPRNIRIEANTFYNNNGGTVALLQGRWVGLRNNTFVNNFVNPPPGDDVGGNVFFNQCTDTAQISWNTMTGPNSLTSTQGLELWGRNITAASNNISNYPFEAIQANSTLNATIQNNSATNNGRHPQGAAGILVWGREPGAPCNQIPRDTQTVTISGNTSTGQAYGIFLGERNFSRNTISNITLTGNTLGPPGFEIVRDEIVTLNAFSGPEPTLRPATDTLPRALPIDAVAPFSSRCPSPGLGSRSETFTFGGGQVTGAEHLASIEVAFSVPANPDDDGTNGPVAVAGHPFCHFFYDKLTNTVLLDDPYTLFTWPYASVLGPGGTDISNGYCTVRAASSGPQPAPEPKVLTLKLTVDFLPSDWLSSKKYMYVITGNDSVPSQYSNGGAWTFWGWWLTP